MSNQRSASNRFDKLFLDTYSFNGGISCEKALCVFVLSIMLLSVMTPISAFAEDGSLLSNEDNRSGASYETAVEANDDVCPAKVELVSAKNDENGVLVRWKSTDDTVKYRVYRKASGEKSWIILDNICDAKRLFSSPKLYIDTANG